MGIKQLTSKCVAYFLAALCLNALPLHAEVFIRSNDSDVLSRGKKLESLKYYRRAWNKYRQALKDITHKSDGAMVEAAPGYYQDIRSILLKRMAHLVRTNKVSTKSLEIEAKIFFKRHMKTHLSELSRSEKEKIISQAYYYLPTTLGFQMLTLLGERSFEAGSCTKAIAFWEDAKNLSSHYKQLSLKKKVDYSLSLARCYKQQGLLNKLKSLLEEMPKSSELKSKLALANFNRAQKALKGFHSFLKKCSGFFKGMKAINIAWGDLFSIREKKTEVITNIHIKSSVLCFKGQPRRWCFEAVGEAFLSKPLVLENTVYIVAKDRDKKDLYLYVLDRYSGKELKKIAIGTHRYSRLIVGNGFYPYRLIVNSGKIHLTTESTHHAFNLHGNPAYAIDFIEPQNQTGDLYKDSLLMSLLYQHNKSDHRNKLLKKLKQLRLSQKDNKRILSLASNALKTGNYYLFSDHIGILKELGEVPKKYIEKIIPRLIKALNDNNVYIRSEVAHVIGKLGPSARNAAPDLIKALNDRDTFVRASAIWALGRIGLHAKNVIPHLIKGLNDKEPYVRKTAAGAIVQLGLPARNVAPVLIKALNDDNSDVRVVAAKALGDMGMLPNKYVIQLIKKLESKNLVVKQWAILDVERIGIHAKSVIPQLTKILTKALKKGYADTSYYRIPLFAIAALGNMGIHAKSAIPLLTQAKKSGWRLRLVASSALRKIKAALKKRKKQ